MKKPLHIAWSHSLHALDPHRSLFSSKTQLKFCSFVVSAEWISPIKRQRCFSYEVSLKSSSRWWRVAKKWGSYHWFAVDRLGVHGFSQNHASVFFWRIHPWQMVGGKVKIRFELAIVGCILTFQGKRHDMMGELFSLAGKRCILGLDPSTLNVILRWVQFLFIGLVYCWIFYLDLRVKCASCFVFFCVLSEIIWDLERILGFFWLIGMEVEDARGRAKQSLDFICVFL
ncbi:hypothetical protein V6N13_094369 [Hibiscus sabdariffa]|uniref:Uncharacterized protein n=1 Tax=Hibiscus sabdariffa TaxID=183260 RepID=A0ABR2PPZ5_9ROSI